MKNTSLALLPCLFLAACGAGGSNHGSTPSLSKTSQTEDLPIAWQSPNIFEKYTAKGNAKLANSWTRKLDTSGISFDSKKTCTLITRRHVLMARHYQRPVLAPVIFHDRSGKRIARHLVAVKPGSGDYAVGLLNEPLPNNYKAYPLPTHSANLAEKLTNRSVVLTDQNRRLFIHQIAAISGGHIRFKQNPTQQKGYRKNLVSGDSGNPSFIIIRGQPVLIETHTTGGPGAGPFYGDATVQAEISQLVNAMDSNYSIRTVSW